MKRMNILMITCHDLGQHLGCYGVETVNTPNIDRLANCGVRFKNSFSTSPVCSPGRGSLHTGRYPQSNGLMGLIHSPWWWELGNTQRHTAQILKEAGYETCLIGVNHVHPSYKRLGYDNACSINHDDNETVNETLSFIERSKKTKEPFFVKVGFSAVHRPFTQPEDSEKGVWIPPWIKNTEHARKDFAGFQGSIKYFDSCVGKILSTLEKSSMAKDTLVLFTSDHGMPYPGAKWTLRKAGIEVPVIFYQPETKLSGGKVFNDLMSNIDVLPTTLELAGVDIPGNVQGVSFKSLLMNESCASPRNEVYSQFTPDMMRDNESRSVLTERFHLIYNFSAGRTVEYPVDIDLEKFSSHQARCKVSGTRPFAQLFDLHSDPHELDDLSGKNQYDAVISELSKKLVEWMKDVEDPLLEGAVKTPYYNKAIQKLRNV